MILTSLTLRGIMVFWLRIFLCHPQTSPVLAGEAALTGKNIEHKWMQPLIIWLDNMPCVTFFHTTPAITTTLHAPPTFKQCKVEIQTALKPSKILHMHLPIVEVKQWSR